MKKCLALLLLICTVLGGCSLGNQAYLPTGDGLDATVSTKPPSITPEQTEQKLTLGYDPDSEVNPYRATDLNNRLLCSLLYQSLFTVDRDYTVSPLLCKNYTVSKDMQTYIFYLEEATFSDGSVLTALDVVTSLLVAMESPVYSGRLTNVRDISVTDEGAVRIDLKTPYENFPILLDIPIVKSSDATRDWPLGTGPYYKDDALIGIRLVRRGDWWCDYYVAATASVIGLLEVDSKTTIRDDFEAGTVGILCADPGSDSHVDVRCDYELWGCENGIFLYLACSEKSKTFSDPAVRAVLTYAIDRDLLVSNFYGDFARSATLPASPDSPYYDQRLAQQYGYNAEKCRDMLLKASPLDMDITLLVNKADSRRVRVARKVAQMLEDVGFTVKLSILSGTSYNTALSKGNYDLHLGQTKLSANMDLSAFFNPKGALNFGGMSDAATFALCQEALANAGNYYTLYQKVLADAMLCPILFRSYAVYTQRGLFTELAPTRDNIFYYETEKTMADALLSNQ